MNRITKPTLLALAASGAITVGGLSLAGVGSAASTDRAASSGVAATPTDPTDPTDPATPVTVGDTGTVDPTTDPAAAPALPMDADRQPGRGRPGEGRHGGDCEPGQDGADHGADRRGGVMVDAVAVAEAIGIDVADLRTALADGQTIAEVATANGVEADAVVDAIVAVRAERLADAVANGRLTQEEAHARLAEQTATIEARVNGTDDATTIDDATTVDSAATTVDSAPVTEETTA